MVVVGQGREDVGICFIRFYFSPTQLIETNKRENKKLGIYK
jgi:hypothetical protein